MSHSQYEHDEEPVRGLPGHLPQGETMLWQGEPDWRVLARTAFHTRAVAIYFAVLLVAAVVHAMSGGTMLGVGATVIVGALGLGLLNLLAWLSARSTVYTITSKRVVIRSGIALPSCVNLPFAIVGGAEVNLRDDGTGDLPLALTGTGRIAYPHLWPHARPWHVLVPQPMLRAVPDARRVAEILSSALARAVGGDKHDIEAPVVAAPRPVAAAVPGFSDAPLYGSAVAA